MNQPLKNIAASVRARLHNYTKKHGGDFGLTLIRYALERFLYRLSQSTHRDRFVLKGALLYTVWAGDVYRPTRDADFLGKGENTPETMEAVVREICAIADPLGGIVFDADSIKGELIRAKDEYAGVRVKFFARLDTARIPVQIDVGFGDAVVPAAIESDYPVLLDAPVPRLLMYPRETVVAEKCEAIVKLGTTTSRMKDYYDLYTIARIFAFDGSLLSQAITATFKRRDTPLDGILPAALAPSFFENEAGQKLWLGFLERTQLDKAPRDFAAVGEAVRRFLWPVLQSAATGFDRLWPAGGLWQ